MGKFEKAVKEKKVDFVTSILMEVEFTDLTINPILKELGLMGNLP